MSCLKATYTYRDETGAPLFEVVRFEPKAFRLRSLDGSRGFKGIRRVPYRLPELLDRPEGAPVYVAEGEKDVDRLRGLGLAATSNAGGAGGWRDELSSYLAGADVVVLPDNDEPGRAHALEVARSLQGVAERVRVLELPNLSPKGDVSDWLDAGGAADRLQELAEQAPAWEPNADPEAFTRRAQRTSRRGSGGLAPPTAGDT